MRDYSPPPAPLTRFIGRTAEVFELGRYLAARRLVTLTGTGGVGKSRLAAEVLRRNPSDAVQLGPVCWVDLGALADPESVPRVLAGALAIPLEPDKDAVAALTRQLGSDAVLVCLDTCEHVLLSVADLAERLLAECPGVTVLATSREPLGIPGEAIWQVSTLSGDEAVELFEDRAALASPGFDPFRTVEQRGALVAACQRLDGLPLAIELAAAWTQLLSPAQILAGLDDSFRLLSRRMRGVPSRHHTLAASMRWSHDLLAESDKVVLRRLAVLRGAFTARAATSIAGPAAQVEDGDSAEGSPPEIEHLRRLVDRSLLVAQPQPGGAGYLYSLLDTVRQFALARLEEAEEADQARDRHLDYFLSAAELAEQGLDKDEDQWRQLIARDRDDINAALTWGLSDPKAAGTDRVHKARRMVAAMSRHWLLQGQAHEGLAFLERACADGQDEAGVRARLQTARAMLGMVSGRAELTAAAAREGADLAAAVDDQRSLARCLAMAAYHEFFLDFERCQQLAVEAHTRGAAAGDSFARDWALVVQAYSLTRRDRHNEAVALAGSALAGATSRGDRFCGSFATGVEVFAALYTGDVRKAVSLAEDMMELVSPLGDYFAVGTNAATAAVALGMAGRIDEGLALMDPVVRGIEESEDVDAVGFMVTLGQLCLWRGDLQAALRWFERGPAQLDSPFGHWTAIRCMPGLIATLRLLGQTEQASAVTEQALVAAAEFGGAYVYADLLDQQGHLLAATNPGGAIAVYHQAFQLRRSAGLRTFYADSLDALAAVTATAGSPHDAVLMLSASDAARSQMGYPRPPIARPNYQQTLEGLQARLGADFDAIWEQASASTLEAVAARVTRGRGRRARPPTGWGALSPAELAVAHRVAKGWSNSQIAGDLFIGQATVKTHLAHICAKLGAANRAAVAAIASRHAAESE